MLRKFPRLTGSASHHMTSQLGRAQSSPPPDCTYQVLSAKASTCSPSYTRCIWLGRSCSSSSVQVVLPPTSPAPPGVSSESSMVPLELAGSIGERVSQHHDFGIMARVLASHDRYTPDGRARHHASRDAASNADH